MNMIEKVAKAICWKNGMNPDMTLGGDGVNFLWHEYEEQAKAAIDAMIGAMPEMFSAGIDANVGPRSTAHGYIYEAMVKAALNE